MSRALLIWLLWLPCAAAWGQSPDDERARVHFVAGNSYFEIGKWNEAAHEFEQAYELSGRPEMLINLSRAHERGDKLREAIADLRLLLERYPQTVYRSEAERRMRDMELRLDERQESSPVVTPPPAPAPVEKAPEEPRRQSLWPPRLPTLLMAGATVGTGVAALVTGLVAHQRYNELEGKCPQGNCAPRYADDRERGQRMARTSTGLSFAALTLAAVTGVFWYLDVRAQRETERARFDLSVGSRHAEARLRLQF